MPSWWVVVLFVVCLVLGSTLWWRGAYAKLLSVQDMRHFHADGLSWPLAASAWYPMVSQSPWDSLPEKDAAAARNGLAKFWSITDRSSLLLGLHWVLTEGHRTDFEREIAVISNLNDADAASLRAQLVGTDDEAREAVWRFDQIRANTREIREVDFIAWDLVRYLMLCRSGAACGYISTDEAADFMIVAQLFLQPRFRDWSSLVRDFGIGRWFWNSESGVSERLHYRLERIAHRLLLGKNSPAQVVNYQAAPANCRWLLVPALAAEGLTPMEPTERAEATEPARVLDDLLRQHLSR